MSSASDLVSALHLLGDRQDIVSDTHGNVSCRSFSGSDGMYIKPSGMAYHQIWERDVCYVDHTHQSDSRRPSVDSPNHLSIYQRNPQVNSICHTHSPHATAFALAARHMLVYSTEHADVFGHTIRCLPYAGMDTWGDFELQSGEKAVLLANHGTVLVSSDPDPRSVVELAISLEMVARKYILMKTLRFDVGPLPPEEVSKWHQRYTYSYGQDR